MEQQASGTGPGAAVAGMNARAAELYAADRGGGRSSRVVTRDAACMPQFRCSGASGGCKKPSAAANSSRQPPRPPPPRLQPQLLQRPLLQPEPLLALAPRTAQERQPARRQRPLAAPRRAGQALHRGTWTLLPCWPASRPMYGRRCCWGEPASLLHCSAARLAWLCRAPQPARQQLHLARQQLPLQPGMQHSMAVTSPALPSMQPSHHKSSRHPPPRLTTSPAPALPHHAAQPPPHPTPTPTQRRRVPAGHPASRHHGRGAGAAGAPQPVVQRWLSAGVPSLERPSVAGCWLPFRLRASRGDLPLQPDNRLCILPAQCMVAHPTPPQPPPPPPPPLSHTPRFPAGAYAAAHGTQPGDERGHAGGRAAGGARNGRQA